MVQQQRNLCACGCGEPVSGKWKRGHAGRGVGGGIRLAPLPSPREVDDLPPEEFEAIVDVDESTTSSQRGGPSVPATGGPLPLDEPEPGDDEPPPHARRDWKQGKRRAAPGKAPRITVGIRGDINAKISLMLEVPGQVWAARDPVCGGTFIQQRPDIAAALTDIVCESSDLVAFFTGPAGGFMRYLNLAVALFPVGQAVMAHHVYHTVEAAPPAEQPDYAQYAA